MGKLMRPIGDLDLHLFGEGTHRRLWELLGPQPLHVAANGDIVGARLAVWAPEAASVAVVGDWNGWVGEPLATVGVSGIWSTIVPQARTSHRYAFDVTSNGSSDIVRRPDPMARQTDGLDGEVSVVPSGGRHEWDDDDWMHERRTAPDTDRLWRAHCVDLQELAGAGIDSWDAMVAHVADAVVDTPSSHVEFSPQPANRRSADSGWLLPGLYAPPSRLGDPDGARRFVSALHNRGLGVLLDWPPDVPGGDFGELHRNEVRNQMMASVLYWLDEFHVDGLRIGPAGAHASPPLAQLERDTMSVVSEEFPDVQIIVG